jgi:hypothetical protein
MYLAKDGIAIAHCVSMFSCLRSLETEDRGIFIQDFEPGLSLGQELFEMLDTVMPPLVLQIVGDRELHFDMHTVTQIHEGRAISHPYALVQVATVKGGVAVSRRYYVVTQGDTTPQRFAELMAEAKLHKGVTWDDNLVASWID